MYNAFSRRYTVQQNEHLGGSNWPDLGAFISQKFSVASSRASLRAGRSKDTHIKSEFSARQVQYNRACPGDFDIAVEWEPTYLLETFVQYVMAPSLLLIDTFVRSLNQSLPSRPCLHHNCRA